MAIRTVKFESFLKDYKERKVFQDETGSYPSECQLIVMSMTEEPELRLNVTNGNAPVESHLALYFISHDEVSHEGMVVDIVSETVRVMSDVWEDFRYAVVYEPNGPVGPGADKAKNPEMFRKVLISGCRPSAQSGVNYKVVVDASSEVLEIYAAWKQGKRWAKAHTAFAARENKIVREAEAEKRTVRKGKWVEVARGRKVPKGTKGFVFWLQDSRWGIKVGIAIPEKDGSFEKETRESRSGHTYESYKNVAWTYAKNCEVIETPEVVENITKKAA